MNVVIVGYGRMGRAVEVAARERGHRVVSVIDPLASGPGARRQVDAVALADGEVVVEFTGPSTAEENVCAALQAGLPVVCGSTGWAGPTARVESAARAAGTAAVIAANFSLGVNLFYAIVTQAARTLLASGRFEPWIFEAHHRAKADAPSGTAKHLAGLIAPGPVSIASIRAGAQPGLHTVGFDGEHDEITLTHRARGRAGFALGAVLAAEWVRGRRGIHGFDAVIADLLQEGGKAR